MTSNAQIQNGHLNLGGLINSRGIRSLAIAGLLTSTMTFAGCQQMGFRTRDGELAGLMSDTDDWELPQSPKSRVPRPNVAEFAAQGRRDKIIAAMGEKNDGPNRGDKSSQSAVVAYGTAGDRSDSSARSAPPILSTPYEDLDLEGDMATLPPALREVLRRQLDAIQRRSLVESNSEAGNSNFHDLKSTSENLRTGFENTERTSSVASNDAKPSERGAGKISIRMSDSEQVSSGVSIQEGNLAVSTSTNSSVQNGVTTAVATAPPAFKQMDSLSASVVQASAVMPTAPSLPSAAGLPVGTNISAVATNSMIASLPTSTTWRQSLSQAIEQLEKTIQEVPASDENLRVSQEVTLRMLYVCQRRLKDAMLPIDKLSNRENDYFQHQMQALYEASNPDAMPVRSRHWSLVMNSQREATNHLAAVSNLEVKSVAFCTEVERYGVVTKFPKYHFQADQEVLLYCEIENVAATKLNKEGYESQLQGSYEILDSQGRKIADQLLPMEPEICQNHRRDYFIVYKIYIPQQIAPGNYQLRLTVEDMKAHKFGQNQLDFQVKK